MTTDTQPRIVVASQTDAWRAQYELAAELAVILEIIAFVLDDEAALEADGSDNRPSVQWQEHGYY